MFAHLDAAEVPPAALARRLGQTRQATTDLVRGLVRHDLLAVNSNPARRGGRLVVLTDRGRALVQDAGQLLAELEAVYGEDRAQTLRALLGNLDTVSADDGRTGPRG